MSVEFDAAGTEIQDMPESAGLDLRDALAAAIEQHGGDDDLPRDEKGRFAPRQTQAQSDSQPEKSGDAEPPAQETAPEVRAEGETEAPKSDEPTIRAPQSWPEAEKRLFAELPPAVQKVILDRESQREAEFTRKSQEFASRLKLAEDLEVVLGPRKEQLSMQGMTPAQAVERLFALSDFAARDPVNFIRQFSQARGIDLSQLVQPSSGADEEYVDPQIKTLQDKISQLEGLLRQRQELEQTSHQQAILQEIQSFATARDTSGQPLRPYYDLVEQDMVQFVAAIRAQHPSASHTEILDRAYRAAVAVNPRVQELIRAQEEQRRKKAEDAKRAAISPPSKPYGVPGSGKDASDLRAMLESAFEG